MIISRPMILASLVVSTISNFFPLSNTRVLAYWIPVALEGTPHSQLELIISQPPPFVLSARDEQTEDCRLFKTCGNS